MAVPLAARCVAAVFGALLLLTDWNSIIGTLIVPRPIGSWLTKLVDRVVLAAYRFVTRGVADYHRRDRIFATQAAAILLTQLVAWLTIALIAFTLLMWPFADRGITAAFTDAGSSIFTLGFAEPLGTAPVVLVLLAAATGLIVVALQIGYLPTLYSAFNRRETEVALLNARAGVPSWGPELLARTFYALGTGVSTVDTLPDLYARWERWAADVAESHTTYLPLVRFRSPMSLSSWVISLLAVLDSAALILTLAPDIAPAVPARLCLRGGFQCFRRVTRAMGIESSWPRWDGCTRSASRPAVIRPRPGPSSWAGGSTTSRRPTGSPRPWKRCRPCGRGRATAPRRLFPRCARNPAASRPRLPYMTRH